MLGLLCSVVGLDGLVLVMLKLICFGLIVLRLRYIDDVFGLLLSVKVIG